MNLSGCNCLGTPLTLSVTVEYAPGEDANFYDNAFPPATLRYYYPSPPPYATAYGAADAYFSTTTWFDDNGFECYYLLTCFTNTFTLSHSGTHPSYPTYPTLDFAGPRMNYSRTGSHPTLGTNTCNPLSLPYGTFQPAIPQIRFRISG